MIRFPSQSVLHLRSFCSACFFFLTAGLLCGQVYNSPPSREKAPRFVNAGDVFGTRNFIENKGQFDNTASVPGKVHFLYDHNGQKIFFTDKGLVHVFEKRPAMTEEVKEAIERGDKSAKYYPVFYYVHMNWLGSNADLQVEKSEKQGHYFTYGAASLNSYAYRKITYRNVYEGIDVEYTIPKDKETGIKYSFILHPGADAKKIKMLYSGDAKAARMHKDGLLTVKSPDGEITEHAPASYYENGESVRSAFLLHGDTISFNLPEGYNTDRTLVIDPWMTTISSLTSNNQAFDVDYDFGNNTFIYGGNGPFKIAMYNLSGTLQWTFSGTISTPISWISNTISNYASNFGVNKFTSQCFTGQGYNGSGSQVVRLNANGNYDNFINNQNSQYREVWEMGFHCLTADVFILGGGTSSNISAATINTTNATLNLSTFQPTNSSFGQDIVSHAIDDQGNIFVNYAGGGLTNDNCLVNSTFNGNVWTQPSTFGTFGELANKSQYVGAGVSSNGFNCLAVNANYLYYYDGHYVAAYNKTNGSLTASTTVSGMSARQQGGIAVDDCDNLYLGGIGNILTYNFNGTSFSTLTPISLGTGTGTAYVYDIKLNRNNKTLFVCGSGFVGTYAAAYTYTCGVPLGVCLFNQGGIAASTTSITCATLGSATVSVNGGLGPYTYTWMPSLQTGSIATGLNPGTHIIIVHDAGYNATYTTSTTFISPVPFTGSLSPVNISCFGAANGSASVINLSGGSGNQSYLWSSSTSTNTQTTPTVGGLGLGNYSVTVTDALTSCAFTNTFTITQPPPLTLNISAPTTTACAGTPIPLTPLIGGGSPNYTYSWTAGPATGTFAATSSPGTHVFSLTAFDSHTCPITQTISLNFINTPTLSVSSVSICPLKTGTLSVSGASSYLWNGTLSASTYTDNPLATTLYTVTGTTGPCSSTATAFIVLNTVPSPTLTSNTPICNGQTLALSAAGGISYQWSGPQGFNSLLQQPFINAASPAYSGVYNLTVTAANSCTAATSATVLVNPTPPLSASGSTICETSQLGLSCSSTFTGCSFAWVGPLGFNSGLQNPFISPVFVGRSGAYQVTVTSTQGCTNTAVANVTVSAMPPASFVINSPLCAGATISLSALQALPAFSYNWLGPNSYSGIGPNPTIHNAAVAASGVYSLYVTNGPCQNSNTAPLTVNPLPTLSIQGNSGICETHNLALNAQTSPGVVSYLWNGPAGFSASSPSVTRYQAVNGWSGVYSLLVTDFNNCSNSASITISILKNPVLSAPSLTVCLYDAAQLSASGAASYFWIGPSLAQASGSVVMVSSASSKTPVYYTVIGTAANSCTASAVLGLTTRPLPKPSLQLIPGNGICLNDKVSLTGFGGKAYQWRGPNQFYMEGTNISFNALSTAWAGSYSLTAIDSMGCRASTDTMLLVHELPSGSLKAANPQACLPYCSDFYFSALGSPSVNATWKVNKMYFSGNSFKACFNSSGDQILTASLFDQITTCSNTVQFTVSVFPKPVADFTYSPEHPIENTEPVIFINTSQSQGPSLFQWSFQHNPACNSKAATTSCSFDSEGTYPVALTVRNQWGCSDTVVKAIVIDQDFNIFIPNAFTPNGDDLNEVFLPVIRAATRYSLSVFDRWGNLLFQTSDPMTGWDGTYKGQSCKSDSYVWKMSVSGRNGVVKELKGFVILQR